MSFFYTGSLCLGGNPGYKEEFKLIQTIPGVSAITASSILAEIGVNMDQFPTADHLSSWAGVAPGNHESAGKKKVHGHSKATRM